jgi:hypothetical protein
LVELEQNLAAIQKAGLGLAAISYDSVAILKNFAGRRKITYPLLSDPDSKIIRAYGILNETVKPGTSQYGIPRPGTYVLDRQGKIVSMYFEEDIRERFSVSDILAGKFGGRVDDAGGAVEAKHVRLTPGASTLIAYPGHRILLTLDVDLQPKMHVYAPGVAGYIAVDWKLEETGAAKARPVQYPAARKLPLKPIHETALVYQGHVRMTREITFGAENALKPLVSPSGEVTLKGSLRYQACDDRECYPAETAPVEWKFRFEGLDRERVPAELQRPAR